MGNNIKSSFFYVSSLSKVAISSPEAGVFHLEELPLSPGEKHQKAAVVVKNAGYSFQLNTNLSFALSRGGKALIQGSLLRKKAAKTAAEESLAEKEGHRPAGEDFAYEGGVRFYNDSPVYGLGDKTGPLDKRGYSYINWNTDDPSAQVDTFKALYKSIPYFVMFHQDNSVGVYLDNTSKSYFDINKAKSYEVRACYSKGRLNLYLFIGPLLRLSELFSSLVGRPPLPPRWALGYQQSRWSYASEHEVEEVVRQYQNIDVPVSVIYLDIAYMDRYMDFTVDETRFPNIGTWADGLLKKGVHIVTIIDAGVKALPGYFLYDQGLKDGHFATLKGEVYHNEVWPGDSVFPAFIDERTQKWWSINVAAFLKKTHVSGIWNDMNEPASFKGPLPPDVDMGGLPHEVAHNIYADRMDKATAEGFLSLGRRPYIVTRAAYATTCHYSTMWTGDNQSIYDHLRLSIPQLCNLSLCGCPMIGNDIGGFSGDTTKELLIRWIELGIFFPMCRNHSAIFTKDQEGYAFDAETSKIYSKAVHLRYRLLSYLYDLLYLAEASGTPVLRPLIANFPADPALSNENSEMMLGPNLLIAPSLYPGEHHRNVYLPDDFYEFGTGKLFAKGNYSYPVPLDAIPLFIKKNTITPLLDSKNSSTDFPKELTLLVCGSEAECLHYEDAGDGLGYKKGQYNLYKITYRQGVLHLSYLHHGFPSHYQKVRAIFYGSESGSIKLD